MKGAEHWPPETRGRAKDTIYIEAMGSGELSALYRVVLAQLAELIVYIQQVKSCLFVSVGVCLCVDPQACMVVDHIYCNRST